MNCINHHEHSVPTVNTLKFRRCRSPLAIEPLYDIHNPSVFSAFHVTHVTMTEAEVAELIVRAKANQRHGSDYVPVDLTPDSLRYFHLV